MRLFIQPHSNTAVLRPETGNIKARLNFIIQDLSSRQKWIKKKATKVPLCWKRFGSPSFPAVPITDRAEKILYIIYWFLVSEIIDFQMSRHVQFAWFPVLIWKHQNETAANTQHKLINSFALLCFLKTLQQQNIVPWGRRCADLHLLRFAVACLTGIKFSKIINPQWNS